MSQRRAKGDDEQRVEGVAARASYLVEVVKSLCPTPADAAGVLAMALGMVSSLGSEVGVDWNDPGFQRSAGALYAAGRRAMQRAKGGKPS